jgi:hypothetical protein
MSESAVMEIVVEDVSEAVWEEITRDLMDVRTSPNLMLPPDSCQGGCGISCFCDPPEDAHQCP